ncbi:MAG TPA: NUDIX hydrolase [Gaiellaceae bacterium]|nr:NUDIX hydrolase [Gaiellaceae bacterium]
MEVLQRPDSVCIVAVDGGVLVAVRQSRAGAGERTLELPAGSIEEGETPEECAARELVEECGLTAGAWRKLGEFWAAPDYATEYVHAFEATDLVDVGIGEREEGDDLVMERLPLRGVIGELSDANSLATLALWLQG